jgi:nucleoside-diphosphate-sugar epimerase
MNILITGGSGFIGSNITKKLQLNNQFTVFAPSREKLNLFVFDDVKEFIKINKIHHIIHCAIEGGNRTIVDDVNIVYGNILMAQNLLSCPINGVFINIASGAEYDRRYEINQFEIEKRVPIDYYGLSKHTIAKLVISTINGFNLRLFGCFNFDESIDRMIRSNITNYINNKEMIIHQDKYMDFVYIDDLYTLIEDIVIYPNLKNRIFRDIDVVYDEKYKLSDIASLINTLDMNKRVPITIQTEKMGKSYMGNSFIFNKYVTNLKGLMRGLQECYIKLSKHEYKNNDTSNAVGIRHGRRTI